MVTGNFALLAGVAPREIERWYLAVYADAFEWVEMPNTLGMAVFCRWWKNSFQALRCLRCIHQSHVRFLQELRLRSEAEDWAKNVPFQLSLLGIFDSQPRAPKK
jgi:hypothetical protein